MQNRKLGPYSADINRILISVTSGAGTQHRTLVQVSEGLTTDMPASIRCMMLSADHDLGPKVHAIRVFFFELFEVLSIMKLSGPSGCARKQGTRGLQRQEASAPTCAD
jgi:hypothetical protein